MLSRRRGHGLAPFDGRRAVGGAGDAPRLQLRGGGGQAADEPLPVLPGVPPPPGMCRGRPLRRCAPPNAPTAPAVRCCRSTPSSETPPRFPTPDALAPPSPGFGRRRTPTREKHLRLSPKSANSGYCSASAPDIIHRQKE